jgi:hypothetical protein
MKRKDMTMEQCTTLLEEILAQQPNTQGVNYAPLEPNKDEPVTPVTTRFTTSDLIMQVGKNALPTNNKQKLMATGAVGALVTGAVMGIDLLTTGGVVGVVGAAVYNCAKNDQGEVATLKERAGEAIDNAHNSWSTWLEE